VKKSLLKNTWSAAAAGFLAATGLLGGIQWLVAAETSHGSANPLFSTKLPNVPGKSLTAVVVHYAPGDKSPSHAHAGSVLAYVLSGTIRSENSATGPAKVYRAGEVFFEPPGSTHLISENGSETEPASLLAIFVADDGAQLTHMSK
jgi:quercetin dioxygenase-like cupin family protein